VPMSESPPENGRPATAKSEVLMKRAQIENSRRIARSDAESGTSRIFGDRDRGMTRACNHIEGGRLDSPKPRLPPPARAGRPDPEDAAGPPEFRGVCEAEASVGFYNLNPEAVKASRGPDAGDVLDQGRGPIRSLIARPGAGRPETVERMKPRPRRIIPRTVHFRLAPAGPAGASDWRRTAAGMGDSWRLPEFDGSDGTLRALGMLTAVNPLAEGSRPVRLVGSEAHEIARPPAATAASMDAPGGTATPTQAPVTTRSPDLLDQIDFETNHRSAAEGETRIGPGAPASRPVPTAPRDRLHTAADRCAWISSNPIRPPLR
jgi:hypothetical protein